jgi:DNA-binding NtrC family response regulator
MITTESQATQAEAAQKAGVNEFMTKPFTIEDLEACIGKVS